MATPFIATFGGADHEIRRQLIAGAELRLIERHDARRRRGVVMAAEANDLNLLRNSGRKRAQGALHSFDGQVS